MVNNDVNKDYQNLRMKKPVENCEEVKSSSPKNIFKENYDQKDNDNSAFIGFNNDKKNPENDADFSAVIGYGKKHTDKNTDESAVIGYAAKKKSDDPDISGIPVELI